MPEPEEFAEALLGQLSVEHGEEEEIAGLEERIAGDPGFDVKFEPLEDAAERLFPEMRAALEEFTGMPAREGARLGLAGLDEFKRLKGSKVFVGGEEARRFVDDLFAAVSAKDAGRIASLARRDMARYLVYSTYAIQYLSKISTTYGDYLDGTVYLNRFVLSSYPRIILYKRGPPFGARGGQVGSGYAGALKMTILEELAHSQQGRLHDANRAAAARVNSINEELARAVLDMGDGPASALYEYMRLQDVPPDFPMAKKANLFFALNPDNFVAGVLGPDVMTYTNIEVDPRISEHVPVLPDAYRRWLGPIQAHHAAFTAMEGMAQLVVEEVLGGDPDFKNYLSAFAGTDASSYRVRKGMGRDFARAVREKHPRGAFEIIMSSPPTTREIKDPGLFLERVG